MRMRYPHHFVLIIAFLFLILRPTLSIHKTQPIKVNPNTQSSPSNFIIYFSLNHALPSDGYLLVTFSPFTTTANPLSCIVLDHNATTATKCVNLNTATTDQITITQSGINEINPNIYADKTVVVQFSDQLSASTQYQIQIMTDNVLPNIGSITSSLQMYAVTDTGMFIEENWNFGQVFLQPKQNSVLSVLNRNTMTNNEPGTTFTNLLFDITIGVNSPTSLSRLKFVISDDFTFTDSSIVVSQAWVGTAPAILRSEILSPNVIITTFNESFVATRKFSIRIADYLNPLSISTGFISVYHLPYNSLSPLQTSQQSIPIGTIAFVPTLTLLTIDGTAPLAPIQFYTETIQYIKLVIQVPRIINSDFVFQIESDVLIIHEGSVYAKTSTVNSELLSYEFYSSNGVRISGFPQIPSGSQITVTMRVQIPAATPIFNFYVSIDAIDQISAPILYNTISSSSAEIPIMYVTALTGSQSQTNKFTAMQTGDSLISFTVTPSFTTNAGSKLEIFTSKNLVASASFNGAASCTIAGAAEDCTITTNSTFTKIQIASNSSHNLFPQSTAVAVIINNIQFEQVSSHTQNIYHFYFSLTISQAVSASAKNMLALPIVIPERQQLTNFGNHFSNDLNNSGSNFPNVFRLVSDDTAQWQNVVQANERRIISVFAYQGWTNFFTTLGNGDAYPGASNIAGFTFTFIKGTTNQLDEEYPLDWDRINIVLDGSETTQDFSIILPTTFLSADPLLFEIMVGVYNVDTRTISYLNIEPQPVSGSDTYISAAGVIISSKPQILTNKITLRGEAGSFSDDNEIAITPGSSTYSATTYQSALIIVSDWQFFDSTTSFSAASLLIADPVFRNDEQTPLSIYMAEYESYLTYIPLTTTGVFNTQFTFSLDGVKLPYNHDLPYYSIYLIDQSGTIDCYNEFINQDKNAFYESYLQNLTFSCNDNSLGVQNTYCQLTFIPNHQIQISSVFKIFFNGMQISTDMCEFTQNPSTTISNTCESNTDKNQLQMTINNMNRLADGVTYSLIVYGVSILTDTIIHYITAQLRDPTSSYVIEKGTRILLSSVSLETPVFINEIQYSKNNPIVISAFTVSFQLPRQLNNDQSFAIVMSKDLSNLNQIASKLSIYLYDSTPTLIPTVWSLNLKNFQIVFEGLTSTLMKANYTIEIHGLKTPSTVDQDLISVIYLRKFDNSYTISNSEESTATFPSLAEKINSLIIMDPYFNTQGLQQQLTFTIQNQYQPLTYQSVWIINLPRYYSESVWNEDYLMYCTIEDSKLDCQRDAKTPYQLTITHSPRIIEIGDTYVLKVLGIPCPRATYLNGNADYVTESIFMGISTNSSSQSYIEYSQLFITDTVINPQNEAGYGAITVTALSSSNMEVLQSTFFIITMECTIDINSGQWIFVTFPQQFDNFNDLSLTVEVEQGANDQTINSSVINRRIGFQLSTVTLTTGSTFDVKISSLPTPTTPAVIDMNKLKVLVASSDLSQTTASSLQLHNLVGDIQFLPSALHIVINNYATISVTAGSYSLPIKIQPSDFSTFQSNMKITFVSDALDFKDSPTYAYLGQQYSTFTIGADQAIIPTIYAFDIIKTQTSISAIYTSLTKYTVQVSNVPITITIPATIDVPLGGCSVPSLIELSNPPYSNLNINFEYDTQLYDLHLFWLNEEMSFNELEFDNTITSRQLSFCSSTAIDQASVTVTLYTGGTNEQAYSLSTQTITVNIISNSSTNVSPSLTLNQINIQKTYAGFDAIPNIDGQLFYELQLTDSYDPLSLTNLKATVKEYNMTLQSETDFLTYIYNEDRDHRIGIKGVQAGIIPMEFQNLLPQRDYTLCIYFENQHRDVATKKCKEFTTLSWGILSRASLKFNEDIYRNELNKALCFFVKSSQSEINQVVNLEGSSCSLSSYPSNYNFNYKGSTQSAETTQTIIYFFTNRNITSDASVSSFRANFDTNTRSITASALSTAQAQFSVDYISTSVFLNTFDPLLAVDGTSSYKPSFSFEKQQYSSSAATVTLQMIELDKPGTVYFILVFNKRITYNKITGHSDIEIRPAIVPSGQQIINCLDGEGQTPLDCRRVVLLQNTGRSVTFSNISTDSMYVLYYVIANQYPLRPVLTSTVANFTVDTSYETLLRGIGMCLMLIFMVMI